MKNFTLLGLTVLAFSGNTFATDVNPMLNDTKIKLPPAKTGGVGKVTMNCTDSSGKILKSGEAGYEDCLQNSAESSRNYDPLKKPPARGGFSIGSD